MFPAITVDAKDAPPNVPESSTDITGADNDISRTTPLSPTDVLAVSPACCVAVVISPENTVEENGALLNAPESSIVTSVYNGTP
jgi:hypothetical protein